MSEPYDPHFSRHPTQPVITKADMHPSHYNDFEWRVAPSSPCIGILMSKDNQAQQNYAAFCDFVNAFKAQGMNPGEAPTVFHIDLRARGHRVTLTGAPGELLVNVRATGPKKTLKQRFLNLFRK